MLVVCLQRRSKNTIVKTKVNRAKRFITNTNHRFKRSISIGKKVIEMISITKAIIRTSNCKKNNDYLNMSTTSHTSSRNLSSEIG